MVGSGTGWSADLLKSGKGALGHSPDVRFLHCSNIWLYWVYLGKDPALVSSQHA